MAWLNILKDWSIIIISIEIIEKLNALKGKKNAELLSSYYLTFESTNDYFSVIPVLLAPQK